MALIRWEPARPPVRELHTMQNEMNRVFGTFLDSPSRGKGAGRAVARRWTPAMDVVETDDHFVLRADLPGLAESDVKIEVEDNVLKIAGERKAEHEHKAEGYYRVERAWGAFSRSIALPEGVAADGIEANFDSGVLEVRIPKPEQQKPRKVEITLGGAAKTAESATTAEGAKTAEGAETVEGTGTPEPAPAA